MNELIRQKLTEAFDPKLLIIENQSHLHRGHVSSPQSGQSHFHIKIQAECLRQLPRVEQQRKIYAALDDAFNQGLHALSMEINRSVTNYQS